MHSVTVNDISLDYTDDPPIATGDGSAPVVLLVMGLGAQRIAWPRPFIDRLRDGGVRVITFDNRDVGASTWLDDAPTTGLQQLLAGMAAGTLPEAPYSLSDMATDAVGLLDHLGVSRAHVVGASMGGMIVQRMAMDHPDHVESLTSIMSTTGDPALPGPTPAAAQALFTPAPITDRQGYIDATMRSSRVIGSTSLERDETQLAKVFGDAFDRGINQSGVLRQYHAILADGNRADALAVLDVPTLVIHGSADPLIPPAAGKATAAAIPGATFEIIEGMGHDLPAAAGSRIAELLLSQISNIS